MNFASGGNMKTKAWRDIWGSGQGVADIHEILPVSALVDRLEAEYVAAWERLCGAGREIPGKVSNAT
jgi:nitronate monooxygenase